MEVSMKPMQSRVWLILGGAPFLLWAYSCGPILPLYNDRVGCEDCDPGVPLEGTDGRLTVPSEQFPWVPLIDACMAEGGARNDCIEALPPEVLAELEAWEAQNAALRRRQLERRMGGSDL